MTDVKELNKLFEYGIKLLDSIEEDSLSECAKVNELNDKLANEENERKNLQKSLIDIENILKKIKE